jgi:hypothetical protein
VTQRRPAALARTGIRLGEGLSSATLSTTITDASSDDTILAQTFTVGRGGRLSGADLLVFDATPGFGAGAPPVSDMTVQITTLFGDFLPGGPVVTSSVVPATAIQVDPHDQFVHVDFPVVVPVVPGESFAFAITGVGIGWRAHFGAQATYEGGSPASVPDPSTLALLSGGGVIVAIRMLRVPRVPTHP